MYQRIVCQLLICILLLSVHITVLSKKETITFIHTDHLGSPIMATDEKGKVKWREDYQPFGKQLTNQDANNNVGFTGHKDDKSLGLTYMQARWYHPDAGRFMSLDPIRYRDIHSFNRYIYGNNNPLRFIDPDGKQSINSYFKDLMGSKSEKVPQSNLPKAIIKKSADTYSSTMSSKSLDIVGNGAKDSAVKIGTIVGEKVTAKGVAETFGYIPGWGALAVSVGASGYDLFVNDDATAASATATSALSSTVANDVLSDHGKKSLSGKAKWISWGVGVISGGFAGESESKREKNEKE